MAARSQRKRKASERVLSVVDASLLAEATARRLDALEDDNHTVEGEARLLDGEDEYTLADCDLDAGDFDADAARAETPFMSRHGRKGFGQRGRPKAKAKVNNGGGSGGVDVNARHRAAAFEDPTPPAASTLRTAVGSKTAKYQRGLSSSSVSTKARRAQPSGNRGIHIEKWNKTLVDMLQREVTSPPPGMVSYDALTAQHSRRPTRPFCAVCGNVSRYTCTRCATRFCSVPCGAVHEQAQCLKFLA